MRRYSPFLGPGNHFGKVMHEKNQAQKIRHTVHHTIFKAAESIFVPGFSNGPNPQYI
jgi:hypothetical protein